MKFSYRSAAIAAILALFVLVYSCNHTVVHGNQHSVLLKWDVVTFAGATITYAVKEGPNNGPYAVIKSGLTATTYTDANVPAGNRCYVVIAQAVGFNDSPDSNQACALVPADTLPQVGGVAAVLQ